MSSRGGLAAPARSTPPAVAPAPLAPGSPYRICCVCWGNICRSPMAEVVLRDRLEVAGLGGRVVLDSAGTSDEEVGRPAHPATRRVLRHHGLEADGHVAREFEAGWVRRYDLLLAMDDGHARTLRRHARDGAADPDRVRLLTSFAVTGPAAELAEEGIEDPWGRPDDAFETVFGLVSDSVDGLVPALAAVLA